MPAAVRYHGEPIPIPLMISMGDDQAPAPGNEQGLASRKVILAIIISVVAVGVFLIVFGLVGGLFPTGG
jgi:hypothetical protein